MNDLIVIKEKPVIPEKWDYNNSIIKCNNLFKKVREMGAEALTEFYIAYIILTEDSKKKIGRKYPNNNFEGYCEDIGIDKKTGYNWLHKYFKLPLRIVEISTIPPPEGQYNVIYADIPWEYDVDLSRGTTRSPENNYPVMDLDKIKKFGEEIVKKISYVNCILFMWITAPKLNWMNDVLEDFGFEYKTNLIWDKVKPLMGHYSSVRHEILIIAGKGICSPICDGKTIQSIDSVQSIEKSPRHSEKPEEFMRIIEKLYPHQKSKKDKSISDTFIEPSNCYIYFMRIC
ncbi:hypothetical protein ES708_32754 [subsurface metagenome]